MALAPRLADRLTLGIPEPVHLGRPTSSYPFACAIYRRMDGRPYAAAPLWTGTQGWIHADLLRPNVLLHRGRVSAVIDFGGAGVGDPATDVIAAWSVFGHRGRAAFREALEVDDGTWNRARGVALLQAALIVPYYRASNPAFAALAARTVREIVSAD